MSDGQQPKLDKTILAVLLRWDYGQKSRGESSEKLVFFETLRKLVRRVEPFWYDEYLEKPAGLQEALLAKAEEVGPDLVFFVPYKDQFQPATLDRLKSRRPTYAWFGDDHWRFDSFTRRYAPHFSFVSTTDPLGVSRYQELGIRPIVTQWAADPAILGESGEPDRYEFDVSFVGAKNEVRDWFVRTLARRGVRVECFGHGWRNGPVSFRDMGSIFRNSKINLNLSNSVTNDVRFVLGRPLNLARALISKKRREQIKGRNFEIPMAGGFQLSNYVPGLERYYDVGREIALFNTPEECADLAKYFLEQEQERIEIARRSHARTKREHSYERRFEGILGAVFG